MKKTEKNKLFQSISADFKIIARKTELWQPPYCEKILHDIGLLLENDCLAKIYLILKGQNGETLRCNLYEINYNQTCNTDDRPGGNDWDNLGGTHLTVVLSYTTLWRNMTEPSKSNFISNLKIGWTTSFENLNFVNLTKSQSKNFSSTSNFIQRIDYK